MDADKTLPLLPRLGRYQITRELGRGTMGVVYEAFDPKLERTVALKTIRIAQDSPDCREFEERFQREAKAAGRLNHPGIVTIHDVGEEDHVAYIAMEFLAGRTLRDILDHGTPPGIRQIVDYVTQVAEGLDYAHRFGIVHRDIKPANIVISEQGKVKISDFGIAQMAAGDLTQAGTILGTPKYMSPEQVRSERLDGRADIFALGVILYEMLAGKPPFTGDTLASIMYKILHEKPPELPVHCPVGLRQIIARCLAKECAARYANAGEMATDLRQYEQLAVDQGLLATSFAPAESSANTLDLDLAEHAPPVRRSRWKWLGAGSALLIVLFAFAYWKSTPPAAAPQNPASVAAPPPADKPAKNTDTATTPATSKKAAPAKPKGFWQRQMDCIKHGNCEKPVHPAQPISP